MRKHTISYMLLQEKKLLDMYKNKREVCRLILLIVRKLPFMYLLKELIFTYSLATALLLSFKKGMLCGLYCISSVHNELPSSTLVGRSRTARHHEAQKTKYSSLNILFEICPTVPTLDVHLYRRWRYITSYIILNGLQMNAYCCPNGS
ncbi:hypothetical protein BCR42DRAFT_392987 [Absidia repens]|uniref:Uncharacterized protein n=1 Tax=Absidia repens TaxID=90262 RepID=A0A1X2IEG2_9FUNG|nr:hypothetical protein BCR42DRAFT_392987 [Absidia repens]